METKQRKQYEVSQLMTALEALDKDRANALYNKMWDMAKAAMVEVLA